MVARPVLLAGDGGQPMKTCTLMRVTAIETVGTEVTFETEVVEVSLVADDHQPSAPRLPLRLGDTFHVLGDNLDIGLSIGFAPRGSHTDQ